MAPIQVLASIWDHFQKWHYTDGFKSPSHWLCWPYLLVTLRINDTENRQTGNLKAHNYPSTKTSLKLAFTAENTLILHSKCMATFYFVLSYAVQQKHCNILYYIDQEAWLNSVRFEMALGIWKIADREARAANEEMNFQQISDPRFIPLQCAIPHFVLVC